MKKEVMEKQTKMKKATCNEKKLDSEEEDVIEKSNIYDIY